MLCWRIAEQLKLPHERPRRRRLLESCVSLLSSASSSSKQLPMLAAAHESIADLWIHEARRYVSLRAVTWIHEACRYVSLRAVTFEFGLRLPISSFPSPLPSPSAGARALAPASASL